MLAAVFAAGVAPADDTAADDSAADIVRRAAILVRAAYEGGDEHWMADLGDRADPDPWLVADHLCHEGAFEAALAFAQAAPRPDVMRLPHYVERLRRAGEPLRVRLAALRTALDLGQAAEADPEDATVPDVLVLVSRARAALDQKDDARALALLRDAEARSATLEWKAQRAFCLRWAAEVADRSGDGEAALALQRRLFTVEFRRKDFVSAILTMRRLGETLAALGKEDEALAHFKEARQAAREAGRPEMEAEVFHVEGLLHKERGRLKKARWALEEALRRYRAGDHDLARAQVMVDLGDVRAQAEHHDQAIGTFRRALDELPDSADPAQVGALHEKLAGSLRALGRYTKEAASLEAAITEFRLGGARRAQARVTTRLAHLHYIQGRFSRALALYDDVLALYEAEKLEDEVAQTHARIANVYLAVGDVESARRASERARGHFQSEAGEGDLVDFMEKMSNLCLLDGDSGEALRCTEQAVAGARRANDKPAEARAEMNAGRVHLEARRLDQALAALGRARDLFDEANDPRGRAEVQIYLGDVHRVRGDLEKARACYGRAQNGAENYGIGDVDVRARWRHAELHLLQGSPRQTLDAARTAVTKLPDILRGFSQTQSGIARESYAPLFALGVGAAMEADDVETAAYFLESGRAGALLEMLGNAQEIHEALIPPALLEERAEADAAVGEATRQLAEAKQTGRMDPIRLRRQALRASEQQRAEIEEKIERRQRDNEALMYPEVDTLRVMQRRLAADEAMILYGEALLPRPEPGALTRHEVALVATRDSARVVVLGLTADLVPRAQRLRQVAAVSEPPVPRAVLDAVRAAYVAPLGLAPETTLLLVSPAGAVTFAPPRLLFPKRRAVFIPSGTTYGVLLQSSSLEGLEVLALGDPDHPPLSRDQRRVARLPESGAEAEAVGDRVLLRSDATKAKLYALLEGQAGEHWRAVHLACHGFLDREDPLRSWLALTPSASDDGCLTLLEVFRMRVQTDCVTLSACETGRGQLVQGEGLVGLARGFMLAGSPRVIVSLWKVDDEATKALMTRFYELWNPDGEEPGLGVAEALLQAQDHVRREKRWSHPYFWAAWVVWGLPE